MLAISAINFMCLLLYKNAVNMRFSMKRVLSLGLVFGLHTLIYSGQGMAASEQCIGRVYAGSPVLSVTESADHILVDANGVGLWGHSEDDLPAFEFVAKDGSIVTIMANDHIEGLLVKFKKSECLNAGLNWFCQATSRDMRVAFRSSHDVSSGWVNTTVALDHVSFTIANETASLSLVSPDSSGKVAVRSIAFGCR